MKRQSLVLLALRLATLGARFALTLIVTGLLGLRDMGILTLAIGVAAMTPPLVGWGLNYYLAQDAVGRSAAEYAATVRDRLWVTLSSLTIILPAMLAAYGALIEPLGAVHFLIAGLAAAETIALENYLVLIGLRQATLANVLVFVRSACWVAPLAALMWFVPAWRSIESVLGAWLVGHALAFAITVAAAIRAGMAKPWRVAPPTRWTRATLRKSWYIYLSDISLAAMAMADRFVITALLGLTAAGVFGFYWSFANALQTLIVSALVQPALPELMELHRRDQPAWRAFVRRRWIHLTIFAAAGGAAMLALVFGGIYLAPSGQFPSAPIFAIVLMSATALRTSSEFLSTALAGARQNRLYALANTVGVVLTVTLVSALAVTGGLVGAAAGLVVTAILMILLRFRFLRHA